MDVHKWIKKCILWKNKFYFIDAKKTVSFRSATVMHLRVKEKLISVNVEHT